MPDDTISDSASSVDHRHLLLVGAGPGLGLAVAHRFATGGYRVTLVARSTDGLGDLAGGLADTGAQIDTIAADASDPEGLASERLCFVAGEHGHHGGGVARRERSRQRLVRLGVDELGRRPDGAGRGTREPWRH